MDVFTATPRRNDNGDGRARAVGLTTWCNRDERDERDELVLEVALNQFAAITELTGAMGRGSVVRYWFEPADRGELGATAAAERKWHGRSPSVGLLPLLVN